MRFEQLLKHYNISKSKPLSQFTKQEMDIIMYGSTEPIDISIKSSGGNVYNKFDYAEGVLSLVKRRHLETTSETARQYYSKYMSEKVCPECHGQRLSPAALSVKINKKSII
ncbi:MAG: hypothetical protein K2M43_00415, partial [Mycoplasmoidaceae bacterium]|nr:hypothetical protein [Mycoplasmoidaceae bacterium]